MENGYWGKALRVDLTSGKIETEEISEKLLKQYVGGSGFGAYILYTETNKDTKPLEPENIIIFGLGSMQSMSISGGGKWSVSAKSPLTDTFGEANGGGDWGSALKKAGYDFLIIKGKADKPSYIYINNDEVQILDGSYLWGLDSYETVDKVIDRHENKKISVACIGQAGENLIYSACIIADKHSFAGRCGLGAVMGSKNLKAVAVLGNKTVPVHDRQRALEITKRINKKIYEAVKSNGFRDHGTTALPIYAESIGDMPIKNWSKDVWTEGAEKISAPHYTEVLNVKPMGCRNCVLGCHRSLEKSGDGYSVYSPGPQYETLGMFGSNCDIDDIYGIVKANDVCNRLGMDTITIGSTVAFLMECFEKNLLTLSQTGGLEIKWGDPDVLTELIKMIGTKQDFGQYLAKGTLGAAKELGLPEELVIHVKGLDLPAHDPRSCFSLALNYATGTRGACHIRGASGDVEMGGVFLPEFGIVEGYTEFFKTENKVDLTIKMQDVCALFNSIVICLFMIDGGGMTFTDLCDLHNAITGWEWDADDLRSAGERIITIQRMINVRDGHGKDSDILPDRMFQAAEEGFRAGMVPDLDGMLDEYYKMRDWDENGIPKNSLIKRLGLSNDVS